MIILMPHPGTSGKGQFTKRLIPALSALGVKTVHDPSQKHHINLGFTKFKYNTSTIKVLRLDGIYYNINDKSHLTANKRIWEHVKKANGVIYQSKFSKKMCEHYLGAPECPSSVIYNGIDPNEFIDVKPIKSNYKTNILAVAKWRKFKRLKDIVASFNLLNDSDACLWILGKKADSKNPRIKYVGKVGWEKLAQYYKMADASIHISYVDACPNVVVESIGSGTPVICNNVGGNPELVKDSGVICKIDKAYDLKNFNPYKCPEVDHRIIADGIKKALCTDFKINRDDLNIHYTAKRYKEFFERIL